MTRVQDKENEKACNYQVRRTAKFGSLKEERGRVLISVRA